MIKTPVYKTQHQLTFGLDLIQTNSKSRQKKIQCHPERWWFHSCAEWFDLYQNLRSPDTVQCTHPFTNMMMRQTRTRRAWKNRDEFKVCKHYKYSNLHNLGSRLPHQSKHHHGFGYYSHLAGIREYYLTIIIIIIVITTIIIILFSDNHVGPATSNGGLQ